MRITTSDLDPEMYALTPIVGETLPMVIGGKLAIPCRVLAVEIDADGRMTLTLDIPDTGLAAWGGPTPKRGRIPGLVSARSLAQNSG